MATYSAWLKQQGLTSSKKNATRWRTAGKAPTAGAPRGNPTYSYGGAIATDPLQIPYAGVPIWEGKGSPNMDTLRDRGYSNITPLARQGGGFSVYGVPTDPTPAWAKKDLADIRAQGLNAQKFASGTVAPWLAGQVGALNNVQSIAQSNFAGLVNQSQANIAAQAAQAGPGAVYAAQPSMAPFGASDAMHDRLGYGAAAGNTAAAGYQGAVDQLQGSSLAQGITSGFAQSVARIPDQYEQKAQDFMRQLAPILAQIQGNREAGEWNRRQAIEQRHQFRQQNAIEQQIAGGKAAAENRDFQYSAAKDDRDFQYQAQLDQAKLDQQARNEAGRNARDNPPAAAAAKPRNKMAQKSMQSALIDARSALGGILTNPDDPASPRRKLSAAEVASQLREKHGVDIAWAYDIARRLGYHARPGEYVSPKYEVGRQGGQPSRQGPPL